MAGVGAALAVGLAVAAFAAAWRRYGIFDFADEGLLLSQTWRVAHGQIPHIDFETGYGPLYFALQAAVLQAGGVVGVRLVLAAAHGVAAALAFALARRLAGGAAGVAAVALHVAFFLPVSARLGTPFNVPYPAWYAGVAGVAVAWLVTTPTAGRLLVVGLVAGATAAIKLNSGMLLAAGAAAACVIGDGRPGRAGGLGTVVLALVALAAVVLVAPSGLGSTGLVLVPPVLAVAALGWGRATADRVVWARLIALAAGFLVVVVPAYGPALAVLGPARFAREVLLVGAGVAGVYELPFPMWIDPEAFGRWVRADAETALLMLAPLAIWGALARVRGEGRILAPAAVAATGLLQLYPRPDFAHLLPLGPLLLPLVVALPRTARARGWAFALAGTAAGVRFAPTAMALAALVAGRVETVPVGGQQLAIAAGGAARLRALAAAVDDVAARSARDAPVLAFPACAIVPFLADRRSAGSYDYFFPGRPDHAQVAALLDQLAPVPPGVAVTCTAEGSQLAGAWDYYDGMVAFLEHRFRVATTHAPFTIREVRP